MNIVIPESHRVELTLPSHLPAGPAEVIVVVPGARDEGARARAMGMDRGAGWVSDDFDAPLRDLERLFEGDG